MCSFSRALALFHRSSRRAYRYSDPLHSQCRDHLHVRSCFRREIRLHVDFAKRLAQRAVVACTQRFQRSRCCGCAQLMAIEVEVLSSKAWQRVARRTVDQLPAQIGLDRLQIRCSMSAFNPLKKSGLATFRSLIPVSLVSSKKRATRSAERAPSTAPPSSGDTRSWDRAASNVH